MRTYFIYWLHLNNYVNPYEDGYVGASCNPYRRFREHINNANKGKDMLVCKKIREHGANNIRFTILHKNLSKGQAFELEYKYRPNKNIGWNMSPGGKEVFKLYNKKAVIIFHKDNPDKEYSFDSYTDAANFIGVSPNAISQALIRKNNIYMHNGWHIKHCNTDKTNIQTINEKISELFKGKKGHTSIFKGVTNRWTKEQKEKIGSYHKGKKLSKEHIEALKEKNRLSPSLCRPITLVHKNNPNKEYNYHSISEASRQLNIPLSRLKSKCARKLGNFGKDGWAVVRLGSQGIASDNAKTDSTILIHK